MRRRAAGARVRRQRQAAAVTGAGPGPGYDWPDSNHGIFVDHLGNVWIGGNGPGDSHIVKFTRDGKFLAQYGKPNARVSGKSSAGQPTFARGSHDPRELRPRREDLRRAEGQRGLRRRRLLQPPRRGARRGHRQDEALLGRVRQPAGRFSQPRARTIRTRRRRSSSTTRCTAPTSRTTASSTSAIALNDRLQVFRHGRDVREGSVPGEEHEAVGIGVGRGVLPRPAAALSVSSPTASTIAFTSCSATRWSCSPASATADASPGSSTACTASPPTRRATSTRPKRGKGSACRSSSTRGWRP